VVKIDYWHFTSLKSNQIFKKKITCKLVISTDAKICNKVAIAMATISQDMRGKKCITKILTKPAYID
jgi:hypothetical protein